MKSGECGDGFDVIQRGLSHRPLKISFAIFKAKSDFRDYAINFTSHDFDIILQFIINSINSIHLISFSRT